MLIEDRGRGGSDWPAMTTPALDKLRADFTTGRAAGLELINGAMPALAIAGVVLALGPVAVSFPQKTSKAASLVDDLWPLITRPTADAVKGWQTAMETMTAQLQGQLLPSIANQLGTTPAELNASLAPQFPAAATGLPKLNSVFTDFADKTRRLDASVADFAQTKQIPYRSLPWLFIGPGVVLALCAGVALVGERKTTAADPEPATAEAETIVADPRVGASSP